MNFSRVVESTVTAVETEGSLPIFFSTFLTAWTTVEWFFPPNLFPISGNDEDVYFLERNIAICLGSETFFCFRLDFRSFTVSSKKELTSFWMRSMVIILGASFFTRLLRSCFCQF